MKKIKELRAKFIMSWAQPMADFLIQRLVDFQHIKDY